MADMWVVKVWQGARFINLNSKQRGQWAAHLQTFRYKWVHVYTWCLSLQCRYRCW